MGLNSVQLCALERRNGITVQSLRAVTASAETCGNNVVSVRPRVIGFTG